jgi:hypothetical protein
MKQAGLVQSVQAETAVPYSYFDEVFESFLKAAVSAGGAVDRYYSIGGHTIRISFAGSALIWKLTRALTHLSSEPSLFPAFSIFVWDSASTGIALPEPPGDVQKFLERREMCGVKGDQIFAAFEFAERMRLSILHRQKHLAVHWVPDSTSVPFYESAASFLTILHWWMRDHEQQLAHAAAIGTASGGILLGGKGGSGKSTTTLACLASGLRCAGDDYVLVGPSDPSLARTVYNTAKLESHHLLRAFPALVRAVGNPGEMEREKAILFLHEHFPEALIPGFPIKAIVLPRVSGSTASRLTEVSPAFGLTAIAPSSMFQLRWSGPEDFRRIASVVRQVPNYILELGTELEEIPELIFGLLARSS